VKRQGVLKAKGKSNKKNAHHSLQCCPRSIWSSGGVAAGKAVKKRLDLKRYSKLKKEVRNNMKPPMGQYISLKDIPIWKIERTVN
jgi:hypothetical protein